MDLMENRMAEGSRKGDVGGRGACGAWLQCQGAPQGPQTPFPQGFLHPLGWDGQQGVLQDAAR